MKGFPGASVIEVRDDHAGDTYRLVYTLKGGIRITVLHAFKKKSTRGIGTPKQIIDTIKQRLKDV
jgi:phage-related protein